MNTPAVDADSSRPRTLAEKVWDDHLVVKATTASRTSSTSISTSYTR